MNSKRNRRLVYGVGINDADYSVSQTVSGKRINCPFYRVWIAMLQRCYDQNHHIKRPTYSGCTVAQKWHSFMSFRAWMKELDWDGKALDKDLLVQGNKIYGPTTCVFISTQLNNFTTDRGAARGNYPIGVNYHNRDAKFRAMCCNPFTGKQESLGHFDDPQSAHEAWRKRKNEHANQLANMQDDPRLANALRNRYAEP